MLTVDEAARMCDGWWDELSKHIRCDGFEPLQWVYCLGADNGYVGDTDWDAVFKDEPSWAEDLFFVYMNNCDDCHSFDMAVGMINADCPLGLSILASHLIDVVNWCFGTEATEEGEV